MPEPRLSAEPIARPAARVLLINAEDRVLLFCGGDPARPQDAPYWFTVGGGIDPGETPVEAAVRETWEETGLVRTPADLIGPVWHEVIEFPFDGVVYRQSQDFFVSRVEHWDVDTSAFNEVEIRSINRYRWWSAEEIDAANEVCYPLGLAGLLRRVVAAGV